MVRATLLTLALVACSDYEFSKTDDVEQPRDEDDIVDDDAETEQGDPPPECPDSAPDDFDVSLLEDCRREPAIGDFDPVIEWQWDDNPFHNNVTKVEIPPIVANMNDDNGDGFVNELDIPDIIVTTFAGTAYNGHGSLVFIDGADQTTTWSVSTLMGRNVWSLAGLAVADLEGDGEMDIVVTVQGGVVRVSKDGVAQWLAAVPAGGAGQSTVSIADMEGDGIAEIVVGGSVIEADGTVRWTNSRDNGTRLSGSFPADVDGDGLMEVVAGGMLINYDGTQRWRGRENGGMPAIVDFNLDGVPEFINVRRPEVEAYDIDGVKLWTYNAGEGGGAPTVADFDGDGFPEVGFAAKSHYRVLEADGSVLWSAPIQEASSGFTSSSVFDFEPDGAAEVVYSDEKTLWVFDGSTGTVEMEFGGHNSGTRFEYPTIADVDNDGSAEIIVPHGRNIHGTTISGLSIIGSETNSWAAARPIWNQHSYHTTHINDDGTVPAFPENNWEVYNNFRAGNSDAPMGLEVPDLRAREPLACTDECYDDAVVWHVPVLNAGLYKGGPFWVEVRTAAGSLLFSERVTLLDSGEMTWLGPYRTTRDEFTEEGLIISVDPLNGSEHGDVVECFEDNNEYRWFVFPCDE